MDILSILTEIINNPNAKRNYVRLSDYYAKNNLIHENEVVETIIKEFFDENEQKNNDDNNH